MITAPHRRRRHRHRLVCFRAFLAKVDTEAPPTPA
jgi:hypothetical protein